MTASNMVQELMSVIEDARSNAESTRSDIDEKKTRLEDMDQVLSEGVSSADNLLEQLEELDGVIQTLEDTVEEDESEF